MLKAMSSARSYVAIQDNVEYAYLNKELYAFLLNVDLREQLRQLLITRWFGRHAAVLDALLAEDRCEWGLRAKVKQSGAEMPARDFAKAARDTAFRRVVTDAYDYRCAASGLRLVLPGD